MTASPGPSPYLGWWVGLVHALLALSWTLYVLFLPGLVASVGLPRTSVIWILVLDQALFAVSDWGSAVFADRIAGMWRRLGAGIAIASVLSALLFAAMPWVAGPDGSVRLIAFIAGWAIVTSFLRAPVLSLLGRIGNATRQGWAVGVTLGLVAMAGAAGPALTEWLRQRDPFWPFAVASAGIALAGLVAVRADAWPLPHRDTVPGDARRGPIVLMAAVLLLAGLGFQWHTALLAAASPMPWARSLWVPLFWGGFALGLLISMQLVASPFRMRGGALALWAGALAAPIAVHTGIQVFFLAAQLIAGAAWGMALHTGLGVALARSPAQRLASPVGLVFSALAVAALCRVLIVALKLQTWPGWSALPCVAWLIAGLGFWLHPWRSTPGTQGGSSPAGLQRAEALPVLQPSDPAAGRAEPRQT
ncbi:hypothetical protein ACSFA8_01780 [Variovorax sp. RT4R15]|uniref:hypothetical protein n=1 Tax=Variovorax sp. RT4R15 TaxID=3443737 RepID=UPI003F462C6D